MEAPGEPRSGGDASRSMPVARSVAVESTALAMIRAEVRDARFPLLGGGYEPQSVDALLERLSDLLGQVGEDELDRRAPVEEGASPPVPPPGALAAELDARRHEAEREADAIRAAAQRDAARVRLDAVTEASDLLDAVRAQIDAELQEARSWARLAAAEGPPARPAIRPDATEPRESTGTSIAIEAIRAIADLALEAGRAAAGPPRAGLPHEHPDGDPTVDAAPSALPLRTVEDLLDEHTSLLDRLRRPTPVVAGEPPGDPAVADAAS